MNMFIISVLAFLFAIGVLVAVHEWGHYIVARMAGVKVLRFSIGFGRRLWTWRSGPDNTEYCISAIPLGGYVKLLDEREGNVPHADRHRTFNHQSVQARIAILVAGPAMNFLFAIVAFWLMFIAGIPGLKPVVGAVEPGSIAAEAGLQTQDQIMAVNGEPVATWEGAILGLLDGLLAGPAIRLDVVASNAGSGRVLLLDVDGRLHQLTEPGMLLPGLGMRPWMPALEPVLGDIVSTGTAAAAGLQSGDQILSVGERQFATWADWVDYVRDRPGDSLRVVILREGRQLQLPLVIEPSVQDDGSTIGRIGAGVQVPPGFMDAYSAEQRYSPVAAVSAAVERTWSMSVLTVRMLVRMVTGDVSVKNISGPINIAQYAGYSAAIGLASFLGFLAVVSLSLGIINLLPVPILDGGQIVYQLLEAIKGKPLSDKAQLVGQQIGIAFLVMLMGFAFYNDLTRVFS